MVSHRKQKYLSPTVNRQTLKASLGTADHIKLHKIYPAPKLLPQTDNCLNFCCKCIKTENGKIARLRTLNTAENGLHGASVESKQNSSP